MSTLGPLKTPPKTVQSVSSTASLQRTGPGWGVGVSNEEEAWLGSGEGPGCQLRAGGHSKAKVLRSEGQTAFSWDRKPSVHIFFCKVLDMSNKVICNFYLCRQNLVGLSYNQWPPAPCA